MTSGDFGVGRRELVSAFRQLRSIGAAGITEKPASKDDLAALFGAIAEAARDQSGKRRAPARRRQAKGQRDTVAGVWIGRSRTAADRTGPSTPAEKQAA